MNLWDFKAGFYDRIRLLPLVKKIYLTEIGNLLQLLPPKEFQSHLDLGTGTGDVLSRLPRAKICVMSDLSSGMLRQAQSVLNAPVVCLNANRKLPFFAASFDLISAIGLLEYLDNSFFFFEETYRIAQNSGFFLFTTSPPSRQTSLRQLTGAGVRACDEKTIRESMERAGWKVRGVKKSWMQMQWLCEKRGA